MKRILLATAAGLILPSLAWATDARLTYTTPSGAKQALGMISAVCGTDSSGDPTQCVSGDTAAREYTTLGGSTGYLGYIVPVCSVVDGVPQVCDFGGDTPDLSGYLTTATAATTYAQLAVQNSFTAEQHFANAYFADPDQGASRDAKFGDRGIAVVGGTKTDTLNVTGTATANSLSVTGASSLDNGKIVTDGGGNIISKGNITFIGTNGLHFGYDQSTSLWLNYNESGAELVTNGNMNVTGTATFSGASSVPDTGTTDISKTILNTESAAARFVSSTTAASTYETIAGTTAAVQKAIGATQGSVTGNLSASGSSLTLPVGSSGLNLVMSYSASGTGALTAISASGTLTPVDIYEVAAWGTTSFKGYTLDSGTITTTATNIDSTFYLTSNAVGTYHIGVGGHLYIVDIFGSGAGKRTFMSWRMVE